MNAQPPNVGRGTAGSTVFLCTVLTFAGCDLALADPLFEPATTADASTRPHAIRIADFNRDGRPDLAVANVRGNSISVLLGNGDGSFQAKADYSLLPSRSPKIVDAADFNDDGASDLLTANQESQTVSVLLGNGDGTFRLPVIYATSVLKPHGGAIGDLNRDGKLDIMIVGWGESRLGVRLGKGDGTFAAEVIHTTGSKPFAAVMADFNRDGYPDVAVANHGSRDVSVFLNNRLGSLFPQVRYPASGGPNGLSAADLDRDGRSDIVTANDWSNNASVLLGNGDGTFKSRVNYVTGIKPKSVVIADVNGDGIPDLLTANNQNYPNLVAPTRDSVSVLPGVGDGSFLAKTDYPVGPGPFYMTVSDLNCDGGVDMVAPAYWEGRVYIRLNATGSQVPCGASVAGP